VVTLALGIDLHVRFVEEPYLRWAHSDDYRQYVARVGRFVPGVGRLRRLSHAHVMRMYNESVAVAIQIKDVPEEVRDAIAARAAALGQSTQVYLRALLEREFRAERNKRLLKSLATHRSLEMDVQEVVDEIRAGREGDR
jgi:hypothetical protein